MTSSKTFGIIGHKGDLGSHLLQRMLSHGLHVLGTDITDPAISLADLLQKCETIHVAAPIGKVELSACDISPNTILVLHDSVMSTSLAANAARFNGAASIVHMLMNTTDTVVIAEQTPHAEELAAHFSHLGYLPQTLPVEEHDRVMAESQGAAAILVKTIHANLKDYDRRGLLTNSGQEVLALLESRSASWTPETLTAIFSNPELSALTKRISEVTSNTHVNNL